MCSGLEGSGTSGAAMLRQTHSFHQNLLVRPGHGGRRRIAPRSLHYSGRSSFPPQRAVLLPTPVPRAT